MIARSLLCVFSVLLAVHAKDLTKKAATYDPNGDTTVVPGSTMSVLAQSQPVMIKSTAATPAVYIRRIARPDPVLIRHVVAPPSVQVTTFEQPNGVPVAQVAGAEDLDVTSVDRPNPLKVITHVGVGDKKTPLLRTARAAAAPVTGATPFVWAPSSYTVSHVQPVVATDVTPPPSPVGS
uniref:Uncharacterized protein n=1 Tax=Chromera velia CCMP2878 TaxID=1169474 RepID=A0A0G4I2Q3_9ALVE|eukprot:Cvel_10396.t1-p1 / transcript=Cvel_10396.t1 / gene=Cvel_10396 / organism=Chromera_velia_CCMP2878 / gene_product=hypothetical protein / transcript_product=hypothetical protein / location=Cvel_scaffold626:70206-70739(+) / protein_length=178 / sequence_SO=supercontig / SO=protein_coding / is_pseudo=false